MSALSRLSDLLAKAMPVRIVTQEGVVSATNPLPVSGSSSGDIGSASDVAASTDTGTFSLIALVKRGLQSLTSLLGQRANMPAVLSGTVTRPADTTAYASGDLVANSTTAGSVTAITIANAVLAAGGGGRIERVRVRKTGTSLTNASFRVHFYSATPTVTNGDNAAWLSPVTSYIGAFDVTVDRAFSNGAEGAGVPLVGNAMTFMIPSGTSIFALIEARGAYTPANAEVFTVMLESYRF